MQELSSWILALNPLRWFAAETGGETYTFLDLAIALAIIIAAAKLGGYISLRLHQPSVLGELLVGLVLGPTLLDFLHWNLFVYTTSFSYEDLVGEIHRLAEVGVLLLMFLAGLELHLSDLVKSGRVAALAGILGVVLPLGLGLGLGLGFQYPAAESIFIGLILSATSVSISAQTLIELGKLRTRVGIGLLGAAVFDDVLVVLGLSIFFALTASAGSDLGSILIIILRMVAYVGGAMLFGIYALPRLTRKIERLPISRGLLAFVFVMILLYAWLAEIGGGMAPITGAFIAGLMFARMNSQARILEQVSTLAYGVFVPIFFVNVGLAANLRDFWQIAGLVAAMGVVAVIGKVLGSGLGAKLAGFSNRESLQMGVGMMSRGEVGLIVANQGLGQGLIGLDVFSAVVAVVILTTVLTPPMLRSLFAREAENPKGEQHKPASQAGDKPQYESTKSME